MANNEKSSLVHSSVMDNSENAVFSETQGLRCPICLDVYTAPRNLPCLHTYCQQCLHKYIVKNVLKGKKGATFICPQCSKETFPPLPDIPVDEWVEHYPYNTVLLSALSPEKRKVDRSCDSCLYDGSSVSATSYCTVCKEALCPTCEKMHKKNKASRDHTIVNIQDVFKDPNLAVNLSVSVSCTEHVSKEFEFYCKSHRSMCCSECFYKSHRVCREVLQLKDHSERLLKEKEARRVVNQLKQVKSHMDQFKNENEASFKRIEAEMKNMPDQIEEIRKKINTLLDNVKAKITMERNALLKEESMIRHEENQQCETISSAISNSLHLLETVLTHGSPLHVLTTLHKIEEQLVHYESLVKEKYCEVRHVDAKLGLDGHLLSLIKCNETTIAKIDTFEKKYHLTPVIKDRAVNTTVVIHVSSEEKKTIKELKPPQRDLGFKPLKDCTAVRTRKFNAEYTDGNNPDYIGITCLPNGKILLVDLIYFTCRLYDSSFQHLHDYKLTSAPGGVCVVEGSRVAVILHWEKKIQLLSVRNFIRPERTINTRMRCYGIIALSSSQFAVSGIRNGNLCWHIVSMDGTEKSHVDVCASSYSSHLAVNNHRTGIYISCYNPAAVYSYRVDSMLIIFKYEHKALDGASGVAVDREDNLYVVGRLSHNIHQVSPSGASLQVFYMEICNEPFGICFTSSGEEFLLTNNTKAVIKYKLM
ncbi:hypothetical protein CHS0354_037518 [Potamilus streckersoni]|uniref:Uncharacterized protein n=1 Tax=Potamilus streckersoni TaxID=2493646 RepID=A0AAE0RPG2_9BIVA|nr:hypothetical protein CHS0354_037518 [Potamilus streckersoni]